MAPIQKQAALYSKLYTKYSNLKKDKDSALDKLKLDQELKFLEYHQVAEEMIEYLKDVNERLELQINDLKNEISSIRSSEDDKHLQYQKAFIEEREKNTKLLEEIDRLKNLEKEELYCQGDDGEVEGALQTAPHSSAAESNSLNKLATKMKRRLIHDVEDLVGQSSFEEPSASEDESANRLCKRTKINEYSPNGFQPACCKIVVDSSDVGKNAGSLKCMFQVLVECLVGMKFSAVSQKEGFCISAAHQSTGYSFSLTWIKNSSGELQLRYHVLSLGSLGREAPEWMKETITFGLSMCTIFFERMHRVFKF